MVWWWLIWLGAAYLSGSVPFGLLLGKWRGVDVRQVASGNVGATNVGRALGNRWGIVCFALDVLKGLMPVLLGGVAMGYAGGEPLSVVEAWCWLALALGAVLGHVFPIWLWFRGGKGVATGLGVMLGLYPWMTLAALGAVGVWLVTAALFRMVSLASVAAVIALPLIVAVLALPDGLAARPYPFLIVTTAVAMLVVWRHRSNLGRIVAGTEPKLGHNRTEASAR